MSDDDESNEDEYQTVVWNNGEKEEYKAKEIRENHIDEGYFSLVYMSKNGKRCMKVSTGMTPVPLRNEIYFYRLMQKMDLIGKVLEEGTLRKVRCLYEFDDDLSNLTDEEWRETIIDKTFDFVTHRHRFRMRNYGIEDEDDVRGESLENRMAVITKSDKMIVMDESVSSEVFMRTTQTFNVDLALGIINLLLKKQGFYHNPFKNFEPANDSFREYKFIHGDIWSNNTIIYLRDVCMVSGKGASAVASIVEEVVDVDFGDFGLVKDEGKKLNNFLNKEKINRDLRAKGYGGNYCGSSAMNYPPYSVSSAPLEVRLSGSSLALTASPAHDVYSSANLFIGMITGYNSFFFSGDFIDLYVNYINNTQENNVEESSRLHERIKKGIEQLAQFYEFWGEKYGHRFIDTEKWQTILDSVESNEPKGSENLKNHYSKLASLVKEALGTSYKDFLRLSVTKNLTDYVSNVSDIGETAEKIVNIMLKGTACFTAHVKERYPNVDSMLSDLAGLEDLFSYKYSVNKVNVDVMPTFDDKVILPSKFVTAPSYADQPIDSLHRRTDVVVGSSCATDTTIDVFTDRPSTILSSDNLSPDDSLSDKSGFSGHRFAYTVADNKPTHTAPDPSVSFPIIIPKPILTLDPTILVLKKDKPNFLRRWYKYLISSGVLLVGGAFGLAFSGECSDMETYSPRTSHNEYATEKSTDLSVVPKPNLIPKSDVVPVIIPFEFSDYSYDSGNKKGDTNKKTGNQSFWYDIISMTKAIPLLADSSKPDESLPERPSLDHLMNNDGNSADTPFSDEIPIKVSSYNDMAQAVDKPTATDKPILATNKPIATADKPILATDKPIVADKPILATNKPIATAEKPTAVEKQTVAQSEPVIVVPAKSPCRLRSERYSAIHVSDLGYIGLEGLATDCTDEDFNGFKAIRNDGQITVTYNPKNRRVTFRSTSDRMSGRHSASFRVVLPNGNKSSYYVTFNNHAPRASKKSSLIKVNEHSSVGGIVIADYFIDDDNDQMAFSMPGIKDKHTSRGGKTKEFIEITRDNDKFKITTTDGDKYTRAADDIAEIVLRADDGYSYTDRTLKVMVTPVNDCPRLARGADTRFRRTYPIPVYSRRVFNLNDFFNDVDSDTINIHTSAFPATIINVSNGQFVVKHNTANKGGMKVPLIVSDGKFENCQTADGKMVVHNRDLGTLDILFHGYETKTIGSGYSLVFKVLDEHLSKNSNCTGYRRGITLSDAGQSRLLATALKTQNGEERVALNGITGSMHFTSEGQFIYANLGTKGDYKGSITAGDLSKAFSFEGALLQSGNICMSVTIKYNPN
ncbi:MAG: hypothetical protein ABIG89_02800 [Candidatus Woesearchaeota archaeon]